MANRTLLRHGYGTPNEVLVLLTPKHKQPRKRRHHN